MDPEPVCPQNVEGPGPHSIPHQDIKTAIPIQGILGLSQAEANVMEDRLPHGNELLKQIYLEGGGPRYSPRAKSIQIVMELDGRRYPSIDDSGY